MNIVLTVLVIAVVWSSISIIVALAIGGMAKARDAGATPLVDHSLTPGRLSPPLRDEAVRTA